MVEAQFEGFEWDEAKSAATFKDRGIDFEAAAGVFNGAYVEREDLRADYGEHRYLVTGETQGIVITVVWTPREKNRRIIAAWPATRQEERQYRAYCKKIESTNPPE